MILKSKSTGLEYTAEYDSEDQDYLKLTPLSVETASRGEVYPIQYYHREVVYDAFDVLKQEAWSDGLPDKVDLKETDGKYQPSVFPVEAIKAFWEVSEYGRKKYGDRDSWKNAGKEGTERYSNAAARHLFESFNNAIDPESDIPHLYAALWNIAAAIYHLDREVL